MNKKILVFLLILAVVAPTIPLICHCCQMRASSNSSEPSIEQKMPSCCSGMIPIVKDCGSIARTELSAITQVVSHFFGSHHLNQAVQASKTFAIRTDDISPPFVVSKTPLYLTLQTLRI